MLLLSYNPKWKPVISRAMATIPEGTRSSDFGNPDPGYTPLGWTSEQIGQIRSARAQLEKEGFRVLANGAFSVVFTHSDWPDRVLKVTFKEHDEVCPNGAYLWWDYCLRNQDKPHIPEMYAVGLLDGLWEFCWMKRYEDGDRDEREFIVNHWQAWPELTSIRQVMAEAVTLGKEDLHEYNIMWCPDTQQWMLVDPVC